MFEIKMAENKVVQAIRELEKIKGIEIKELLYIKKTEGKMVMPGYEIRTIEQ